MTYEKTFHTILMIACTEKAWQLAEKTKTAYLAAHPEASIDIAVKCRSLPERSIRESLREYVGKRFHDTDAILFFAAAGIAVRTIAPFVQDKYRDPAVLVVDEGGVFCISLLSGHVGGANGLCKEIAEMIGAEAVITTATDREGKFAVDSFASERGLWISSHTRAKEISARVVAGERVKLFDAFSADTKYAEESEGREAPPLSSLHGSPQRECAGKSGEREAPPLLLPYGSPREKYSGLSAENGVLRTENRREADIIIDVRKEDTDLPGALYLVPKAVSVGIGCRRGKPEEEIEKAVMDALTGDGIFLRAAACIASVDLKAEEAGLISFAEKLGVPFLTFSADELKKTAGNFTASEFVRSVTGVDNVCERAAVAASGQGRLLLKKRKYEGVTVAAAVCAAAVRI